MKYEYLVSRHPDLSHSNLPFMAVDAFTQADYDAGLTVTVNREGSTVGHITSRAHWEAWTASSQDDTSVLEVPYSQTMTASPEVLKDHINPSHYQGYIQTEKEVLQWLEAMQYLPRFRNPESFVAAVELQGRKYFDRNGGKDEEVQELQKGLWYFKFLVAFLLNGSKPIRVKDIEEILNPQVGDLVLLKKLASVLDFNEGMVMQLQGAGFSTEEVQRLKELHNG